MEESSLTDVGHPPGKDGSVSKSKQWLETSADNFLIPHPNRDTLHDSSIKLYEGGNYCTSDETVYIGESVSGNNQIGLPVSELYLAGKIWIEIKVMLQCERDTYLDCVFVVKNSLHSPTGDEDRLPSGMERDRTMLVEIAKSIELPEGMRLGTTRALIRLQRINRCGGFGGKQFEGVSEVPPLVVVGHPCDNGETNILGMELSRLIGSDVPSELIQSRPQAIKELPIFHSDFRWDCMKLSPTNAATCLQVVLCSDGIRFRKKFSHESIKNIQVIFRPFGFHSYID